MRTQKNKSAHYHSVKGESENPFPALIEGFFLEYLIADKGVSSHTLAAYRDVFKLLFGYLRIQIGKSPDQVQLQDIDAERVSSFLFYLEKKRGVSIRSRNHRLTVLKSFFRHVLLKRPEYSHQITRILATPNKRYKKTIVDFLNASELEAILNAPDVQTWTGRRDKMLLMLGAQTGLRLSELLHLRMKNLHLGAGAHLTCEGKGRKVRPTPLTKQVKNALQAWVRENDFQNEERFVFPLRSRDQNLSPDAVQLRLKQYVNQAKEKCPSLESKRVTPHVLRHTSAMNLLHAGVDCSVIALWLGHESLETTKIYLEADLALKEEALQRTNPYKTAATPRYRPDGRLMKFLSDI